MKVIFVSGKHGQSKTVSLGRWTRNLLSLCLLGVAPLSIGGMVGYHLASGEGEVLDQQALAAIKEKHSKEQILLSSAKQQAEQQVQALTLRMAQLQARLVRLDALGERVSTVAKLDKGEFDFDQVPAVGGPETDTRGSLYENPDFVDALDNLTQRIDNREQQLEILETLMANRKVEGDVILAGRPIKKGWMSSHFGHRTDPFNGRVAMHEGVDFAGKLGSDIITVASGVVTLSLIHI